MRTIRFRMATPLATVLALLLVACAGTGQSSRGRDPATRIRRDLVDQHLAELVAKFDQALAAHEAEDFPTLQRIRQTAFCENASSLATAGGAPGQVHAVDAACRYLSQLPSRRAPRASGSPSPAVATDSTVEPLPPDSVQQLRGFWGEFISHDPGQQPQQPEQVAGENGEEDAEERPLPSLPDIDATLRRDLARPAPICSATTIPCLDGVESISPVKSVSSAFSVADPALLLRLRAATDLSKIDRAWRFRIGPKTDVLVLLVDSWFVLMRVNVNACRLEPLTIIKTTCTICEVAPVDLLHDGGRQILFLANDKSGQGGLEASVFMLNRFAFTAIWTGHLFYMENLGTNESGFQFVPSPDRPKGPLDIRESQTRKVGKVQVAETHRLVWAVAKYSPNDSPKERAVQAKNNQKLEAARIKLKIQLEAQRVARERAGARERERTINAALERIPVWLVECENLQKQYVQLDGTRATFVRQGRLKEINRLVPSIRRVQASLAKVANNLRGGFLGLRDAGAAPEVVNGAAQNIEARCPVSVR